MAVYKVPQDVEGEDKFLGPLTFKQFLFGGGAAITGYIMFLLLTKNAAFVAFIFLPFFIVFAALAFPWNKDQPTDIWLASMFRFMFFPRKRIWNQSGIKNLVTITAPKRNVRVYSDGLEQSQVKDRFNALASVIDSRGWAIKNLPNEDRQETDRLVSGNTVKPSNDKTVVEEATDMMDEKTNPIAQQFDSMIQKSTNSHRQETLDMVNSALHPNSSPAKQSKPKTSNSTNTADMWFLNQPEQPKDPSLTAIKDIETINPGQATTRKSIAQSQKSSGLNKTDEDSLLAKVHHQQEIDAKTNELGHIKTIQPLSAQLPTVPDDIDAISTSTTPVDPDILALADNDDLNIETIARQINKSKSDDSEVIINLHR